jgi:integrase
MMRAYLGSLAEQLAKENQDRTSQRRGQILFINARNRRVKRHEWYGERLRISISAIRHSIVMYGRRARIPECELHPHALRHRFGILLDDRDIPTIQSMALMGHKTEKAHLTYRRVNQSKLQEVMDKLQPFQGLQTKANDLLSYYRSQQKKPHAVK